MTRRPRVETRQFILDLPLIISKRHQRKIRGCFKSLSQSHLVPVLEYLRVSPDSGLAGGVTGLNGRRSDDALGRIQGGFDIHGVWILVVYRRCGGDVSRRVRVVDLRRGSVIHGNVDGTDGAMDRKGICSVITRI